MKKTIISLIIGLLIIAYANTLQQSATASTTSQAEPVNEASISLDGVEIAKQSLSGTFTEKPNVIFTKEWANYSKGDKNWKSAKEKVTGGPQDLIVFRLSIQNKNLTPYTITVRDRIVHKDLEYIPGSTVVYVEDKKKTLPDGEALYNGMEITIPGGKTLYITYKCVVKYKNQTKTIVTPPTPEDANKAANKKSTK